MIGETIRFHRKKLNFTQEEFAKKIGVSAGAVSKWETGASLPDTELIVPLAQQLRITTDELFSFQLILSEDDLDLIKKELTGHFLNKGFAATMVLVEEYTKQYPYSDELTFQLGKLIWKYSFLSPFESEKELTERLEKALEKFSSLFSSKDEYIRLNALYTAAVIQLSMSQFDKVEELLDEIPALSYDTFFMRQAILENKEDFSTAIDESVKRLFERVNEILSLLSVIARLYGESGSSEKMSVYQEVLEKTEKIFQPVGPSTTDYRKIRQLSENGNKSEAANLFNKVVRNLINQPLGWENHFLFSGIALSAGEEEQWQARKLYLTELVNDFAELSSFEQYDEAKRMIHEFEKSGNVCCK